VGIQGTKKKEKEEKENWGGSREARRSTRTPLEVERVSPLGRYVVPINGARQAVVLSPPRLRC
jgi:hypothetical protein